MKVIIPVAGAGTKLRPHTYTQPKALIPVAGKPILDFIVDQLLELGLNDFIFVVGYLGEKIKDHVEDRYPQINADFAIQTDRSGVGHAIWSAKEFIDMDEEALIFLGDTIVQANIEQMIKNESSALAIKKVDDPRKFGVVEFDNSGKITGVVEKPRFPKSNMALVGVYKIHETKVLFDCLEEMVKGGVKEDEEIHLTDALMKMIDQGVKFQDFKADNWYDCGNMEILLETNAKLLKESKYVSSEPEKYSNTVLIQPVNIAADTKISNSIIGPNVTIGQNAVINRSILSDSIIGAFAKLEHVVLRDSIIGSDTSITGFSQQLNIGDNTDIDFRSNH